ncbi:MAG: PAS domain S-box protein [Chitinivibrionales bacterium]|nr:PAS domain S-box protein [Chitinivibrionales bacterium]
MERGKDQAYRDSVAQNREHIVEILAHMSFGDYGKRPRGALLTEGEFAEVYCGFDLLIDDLEQARAEVDEQNRLNHLRAELWKLASTESATAENFVNTILESISAGLGLTCAIVHMSENSIQRHCFTVHCSQQHKNPVAYPQIAPDDISALLSLSERYSALTDVPDFEQNRCVHDLVQCDVDIFNAVPCHKGEYVYGCLIFGRGTTQPKFTEKEKWLLAETANIITLKISQIAAQQALREVNAGLEKQVTQRTTQLTADIAKRIVIEKSLRESEEKYRILIETSPDAIVVTDLEANIIMVNDAALKMHGARSPGEMIGMNSLELIVPDDRQRAMAHMKIIRSMGKFLGIQFSFIRKDRSVFPGEMNAALLPSAQGEPYAFIAVIRDISERRRLEREALKAQKLESLGVLAGGIAHDFNNYLTGIISNTSLARSEITGNAEAEELLEASENAAVKASTLTRQLLTFSRGGSPLIECVNLTGTIKDAVRFCLSGRNVTGTTMIDDNLDYVDADNGQINQVLNNIFINAVQAMPHGGELTVSADNVTCNNGEIAGLYPGHFVRIAISDRGEGIAAQNISRIFDPYFTTKPGGNGLGLATAYSIINRHGGLLRCESQPGNGATFEIYLPVSSEQPVPITSPAPKSELSAAHILVVDDNESVLSVISRVLKKSGHVPICVKDGNTAHQAFAKAAGEGNPFDLAILDLTISGGEGGVAILRALKKMDPDLRAVVVSGYSNDPVMADYQQYGFCDRIAKPFQTDELRRVVNENIRIKPVR